MKALTLKDGIGPKIKDVLNSREHCLLLIRHTKLIEHVGNSVLFVEMHQAGKLIHVYFNV